MPTIIFMLYRVGENYGRKIYYPKKRRKVSYCKTEFGNIIVNIPSDRYQLAAICLGFIGCIVLGVGIYREYGGKNRQ